MCLGHSCKRTWTTLYTSELMVQWQISSFELIQKNTTSSYKSRMVKRSYTYCLRRRYMVRWKRHCYSTTSWLKYCYHGDLSWTHTIHVSLTRWSMVINVPFYGMSMIWKFLTWTRWKWQKLSIWCHRYLEKRHPSRCDVENLTIILGWILIILKPGY